ncbi:MAG: hypothetical protein ABSF86_23920, partial [Steroidobacteraceae bacterium]
MPVATNWVVRPAAMLELAGVKPIDTSVAGVTVKPVEPEIVPTVAVIVTDPWPSAVASPLEPD